MYRIAVGKEVNGIWQLDHYASEKECEMLKPSTAGGVEELLYDPSISCEPSEMGLEPGYGYANIKIWRDVSDTHRIEQGMMTLGMDGNYTPIYHNDIYRNGVTGNVHLFMYPDSWIWLSPIQAFEKVKIEVLGNIHMNPELLEAK